MSDEIRDVTMIEDGYRRHGRETAEVMTVEPAEGIIHVGCLKITLSPGQDGPHACLRGTVEIDGKRIKARSVQLNLAVDKATTAVIEFFP